MTRGTAVLAQILPGKVNDVSAAAYIRTFLQLLAWL
jgi:hypothetical protein